MGRGIGGLLGVEGDQGKQEWYTNKELYEMMVDLSKGLETTNSELAKTQTLIRDYNGLRQKIDECQITIEAMRGKSSGGKDMWGYVVGAIGVIMALISYVR